MIGKSKKSSMWLKAWLIDNTAADESLKKTVAALMDIFDPDSDFAMDLKPALRTFKNIIVNYNGEAKEVLEKLLSELKQITGINKF